MTKEEADKYSADNWNYASNYRFDPAAHKYLTLHFGTESTTIPYDQIGENEKVSDEAYKVSFASLKEDIYDAIMLFMYNDTADQFLYTDAVLDPNATSNMKSQDTSNVYFGLAIDDFGVSHFNWFSSTNSDSQYAELNDKLTNSTKLTTSDDKQAAIEKLQTALDNAKAAYTAANTVLANATSTQAQKQSAYTTATAAVTVAQTAYNNAVSAQTKAANNVTKTQSVLTNAKTKLETAQSALADAKATYEESLKDTATKQAAIDQAEATYADAQSNVTTCKDNFGKG